VFVFSWRTSFFRLDGFAYILRPEMHIFQSPLRRFLFSF